MCLLLLLTQPEATITMTSPSPRLSRRQQPAMGGGSERLRGGVGIKSKSPAVVQLHWRAFLLLTLLQALLAVSWTPCASGQDAATPCGPLLAYTGNPAVDKNLALNRPATAVSELVDWRGNTWKAGFATDGEFDPYSNGDLWAASEDPPLQRLGVWWSVDLGSVQSVGSVVIYQWYATIFMYRLRGVQVNVGNVGGAGAATSDTLCNVITQPTDQVLALVVNCSKVVRGRLVTLTQLNNNENMDRSSNVSQFQLNEVLVFSSSSVCVDPGPPNPTCGPDLAFCSSNSTGAAPTNLALNKPVSSSGFQSGSPAFTAVDGVFWPYPGYTDGWWGSRCFVSSNLPGNFTAWLSVDLGPSESQAVGSVTIYNRADCCSNRLQGVRIYVGNSGGALATANDALCGVILQDTTYVSSVVTSCAKTLTGRYVTVVQPTINLYSDVDGTGVAILQLCEVVVLPPGARCSDLQSSSDCGQCNLACKAPQGCVNKRCALAPSPPSPAPPPRPPPPTSTYTVSGDGLVARNGTVSTVLLLLPSPYAGTANAVSIFASQPIGIGGRDFEASFVLRMNCTQGCGDGFTFIIQADTRGPQALACPLGSLGYACGDRKAGVEYEVVGAPVWQIKPSLGVEFDILKNVNYGDQDNNHIAIINGGSTKHPSTLYAGLYKKLTKPLQDGALKRVWISYKDILQRFEVYFADDASLTKPQLPTLSRPFSLAQVLGNASLAYVGFTAAESAADLSITISNWTYSSSPAALYPPPPPPPSPPPPPPTSSAPCPQAASFSDGSSVQVVWANLPAFARSPPSSVLLYTLSSASDISSFAVSVPNTFNSSSVFATTGIAGAFNYTGYPYFRWKMAAPPNKVTLYSLQVPAGSAGAQLSWAYASIFLADGTSLTTPICGLQVQIQPQAAPSFPPPGSPPPFKVSLVPPLLLRG